MQQQPQPKIAEPPKTDAECDEELSIRDLRKKVYLPKNQGELVEQQNNRKRSCKLTTMVLCLTMIVVAVAGAFYATQYREKVNDSPVDQTMHNESNKKQAIIEKQQASNITSNLDNKATIKQQKATDNINGQKQKGQGQFQQQKSRQQLEKEKQKKKTQQKQKKTAGGDDQRKKQTTINRLPDGQHIQPTVTQIQTHQNTKQKSQSKTTPKINDQIYSKLATIQQKALKELHPLDLSIEAKQALLNKYKRMPKVDPQISTFMPIVQDREKEILPILEHFQKFNEIVHYSSLAMSDKERKEHEAWFKKKMQDRHQRNQKKLKQQAAYATNPDAIFTTKEFKITRGQWHSAFEYHTLVGVNLSTNAAAKKIAEKEVQYFEKKYGVGKYERELGMCIISPGINNEAFDRYLWHIESVLQQNYTNYRLIIIDDASTDKTVQLLAKHMRWRNLSEDKFVLIKNKKGQKATANVFYATHKYCKLGQIQVTVDADDELLGRQALKVINANYQKHKYLTLYSSLIFSKGNPLKPGHVLGRSRDYFQSDILINNFRRPRRRGYSCIRTMVSDLFLLMKPQTLQYKDKQFYSIISDNAIYYTAMEMSCGRIKYLPQLLYYYNTNTGINDDAIRTKNNKNRQEYAQILKHINDQKSYRCLALEYLMIVDYPI